MLEKGRPDMTTKRHILCVDGHSDTCELMSVILADFEVVAAHSKGEALLKATDDSFDLYLLEYYSRQLPLTQTTHWRMQVSPRQLGFSYFTATHRLMN